MLIFFTFLKRILYILHLYVVHLCKFFSPLDDVMVDIDGPARCPYIVEERKFSVITVEYTPTVPGVYTMRLSIRGEKLPGSPLTINVT